MFKSSIETVPEAPPDARRESPADAPRDSLSRCAAADSAGVPSPPGFGKVHVPRPRPAHSAHPIRHPHAPGQATGGETPTADKRPDPDAVSSGVSDDTPEDVTSNASDAVPGDDPDLNTDGSAADATEAPDAAEIDDLISELARIAGLLATSQAPDSAASCLRQTEQLLAIRDRITAAITARVHSVHITAEAKTYGHASTSTWLRSAAGMTAASAARLLRISNGLAALPTVWQRFTAGTLSEGAVDAITQTTDRLTDDQAAQAEPILLDLADRATPAEIRVGRYLRDLLDPETLDTEADRDYARRFLLVRPSPTGGMEGEFRLPREAGARLRELLTAYARPHGKTDDRPLRVRQADAFAALLTKHVSTELLVLVRAESLPADLPSDLSSAPASDPASDPSPDVAPDFPSGRASAGGDGPPARRTAGKASESACEPSGASVDTRATVQSPPGTRPDGRRLGERRGNQQRADARTAGVRSVGGSGPDGPAGSEEPRAADRADACGTCGHIPDRLAPGLLIATGQLLPISDVHRLARTSRLVRMVVAADGQVLDVGRAVRLATPAQRRALVTRYATCYEESCPIPADMAEVDHVFGWADGGTTDLDHLAPCCSWHNRAKAAHPERYAVRRNDDGTWTLIYLGRKGRYAARFRP